MMNTLNALKQVISEAIGDTPIKFNYIVGRHPAPAESELPIFCIYGTNTNQVNAGTGGLATDMVYITIDVKISMRDYLKGNTDVYTVAHQQALYDIMEKRDTHGQTPLQNTVLGAIRSDRSLKGTVGVVKEWNIDYNTLENGRLAQATMRITATRNISNC